MDSLTLIQRALDQRRKETEQSWRIVSSRADEIESLKKQIEDLTDQVDELTEEVDEVTEERDKLRKEVEKLRALAIKKDDLDTQARKLDGQRSELRGWLASAEKATSEMGRVRDGIRSLCGGAADFVRPGKRKAAEDPLDGAAKKAKRQSDVKPQSNSPDQQRPSTSRAKAPTTQPSASR
ncbi:hypothetical protein FB45DRAFT_898838 [Roridomyces roridus]|uniref:Uncharacterized protein n=1 Tax=Roridomyces roridus TaxID=1738132 RepID=A0AAD7CCE5_9AGAR|nr:hypothetical protein FB45DRAFT_898838 [Roridomyces roridus]